MSALTSHGTAAPARRDGLGLGDQPEIAEGWAARLRATIGAADLCTRWPNRVGDDVASSHATTRVFLPAEGLLGDRFRWPRCSPKSDGVRVAAPRCATIGECGTARLCQA